MKYDVSVKRNEDENSSLKAIVTLTLGEAFTIKGIKLIEGSKGLFVSMPNYKSKDDEYKDICYPMTSDFRKELEAAIIDKYNGINKVEPEITNCRVTKLDKESLVGLATVTLDDQFVIGNIKIYDGGNGLFISMPSYKNKDGEYKDIYYPSTVSFKEKLTNEVLTCYENLEKEKSNDIPESNHKSKSR